MGIIHIFAFLSLLASTVYYRSGPVFKNSIFNKAPLPKGFIANGNFDSDCHDIGTTATPDIAFCEDAAFWDLHDTTGKLSNRLLVLGCDPNRQNWNTVMGPLRDPNPRGSLWLYTPETPTAPGKPVNSKQLQRLELQDYPSGHDFHPLGLEIWPSYGGNASYLYAVNHARARTVIEQFLLDPSNPTIAKHIRTISSPWFISPNALALTSPDSFYVSNDHLFTRRLPILGKFVPITETLLSLPFSFVSHVTLNPPSAPTQVPNTDVPTIQQHAIAAPFIPFANGVSISPGGHTVAVASTTLNSIFFYSRDPATNKLTYKSSVPVPFCPDNIRYAAPESHDDDNAELVVAGHPHFPSVVEVAEAKPGAVGLSWVVSITHQNQNEGQEKKTEAGTYDVQAPYSAANGVPINQIPKGYKVETIFQSNGTGFSTGATGLKDSLTGNFYIAGLYAPQGAMVCEPSSGK